MGTAEVTAWESLLARVSCVDVFDCGMRVDEPIDRSTQALRVVDAERLAELRDVLQVRRATDGRCMCLGETTFRLRAADGELLASVALHHGSTLLWNGWPGDAELRAGAALVEWLARNGVTRPHENLSRIEAIRQQLQVDADTWALAAPNAAAPLMSELLGTSQTGRASSDLVERLRVALTAGEPNGTARCANLLAWFGSGSGKVSGHPVHEGLLGQLLCELPVRVVVAALNSDDRAEVWRGGVRHFAGWKSRTGDELEEVPIATRRALLATAEAAGNTDNWQRLRSKWWASA